MSRTFNSALTFVSICKNKYTRGIIKKSYAFYFTPRSIESALNWMLNHVTLFDTQVLMIITFLHLSVASNKVVDKSLLNTVVTWLCFYLLLRMPDFKIATQYTTLYLDGALPLSQLIWP